MCLNKILSRKVCIHVNSRYTNITCKYSKFRKDEIKKKREKLNNKVCRLISFSSLLQSYFVTSVLNPLPDMPTLGSSTSAANKDMMAKISAPKG